MAPCCGVVEVFFVHPSIRLIRESAEGRVADGGEVGVKGQRGGE